MTATDISRFWSKVNKRSYAECWEWAGQRNWKGYAHFYTHHKNHAAHRIAYELIIGPIPPDKQLDHLCRNRGCVNPYHLEAVTSKENVLRGIGVTAQNARKTHCIHGHPFDKENTHIRVGNNSGYRSCKICRRKEVAKRKQKLISEGRWYKRRATEQGGAGEGKS